jgi:hypothetical protein
MIRSTYNHSSSRSRLQIVNELKICSRVCLSTWFPSSRAPSDSTPTCSNSVVSFLIMKMGYDPLVHGMAAPSQPRQRLPTAVMLRLLSVANPRNLLDLAPVASCIGTKTVQRGLRGSTSLAPSQVLLTEFRSRTPNGLYLYPTIQKDS